MEKYKEIHLQAYADGKKLNLLDFNELINIKGLDYMTQIDGEIIICRHNIEEDKKIGNLTLYDTKYPSMNFSERKNLKEIESKINEIVDYINKENK